MSQQHNKEQQISTWDRAFLAWSYLLFFTMTLQDIVNAVPYVMKYKRHPVTGQPLLLRDLVKLNFHKNADGEYHCPVMNKVQHWPTGCIHFGHV